MTKQPIIAIAEPTEGTAGETGLWRMRKPVIDYSKCNKCNICWLYCPEAAIIRHQDYSVEINYDYCKGCGICANECPRKAIKMESE